MNRPSAAAARSEEQRAIGGGDLRRRPRARTSVTTRTRVCVGVVEGRGHARARAGLGQVARARAPSARASRSSASPRAVGQRRGGDEHAVRGLAPPMRRTARSGRPSGGAGRHRVSRPSIRSIRYQSTNSGGVSRAKRLQHRAPGAERRARAARQAAHHAPRCGGASAVSSVVRLVFQLRRSRFDSSVIGSASARQRLRPAPAPPRRRPGTGGAVSVSMS